ncbi:SCO-spondin-like [Anoplophora glabripennis]|uniref:SCO-spondin-like n=1 Tax=Anoplophora glabripennis TaxID=217634 RepID=UPI0008742890|nr:SCO-spondin-like [Anoplophora glabripennis]
MGYIFYSSLFCLILVYSVDAFCGKNEVYYECQPCAAINCFESPPFFCPKICQNPGCYCAPGYLRQNGICIPEEQCSSGFCGPHASYSECQPCAAINCGDRDPEVCLDWCINPGCYCDPGYLRYNGVCIPEKFCPTATCGKNEVYRECQPCAAINCGDRDPEVCLAWCINPGCYCKKGFLRKNGVCVPEKFCSDLPQLALGLRIAVYKTCKIVSGLKKKMEKITSAPYMCALVLLSLVFVYSRADTDGNSVNVSCYKNEVYYQCQPCGAINCGDKPTEICTALCQKPGCYCKPGYLRKHGICVPEKFCDVCGPFECYYECQPCRPLNCGDPKIEICPLICHKPGCYCIPGYLKKNGTCVPEKLCSGCIE